MFLNYCFRTVKALPLSLPARWRLSEKLIFRPKQTKLFSVVIT